MTNEDFIEALNSAGITLTTQQVRQFERYYELLVATNEHVNLTAITEKKDVYLKHFYDSLLHIPTQFLPSINRYKK